MTAWESLREFIANFAVLAYAISIVGMVIAYAEFGFDVLYLLAAAGAVCMFLGTIVIGIVVLTVFVKGLEALK